MSRIGNAIIEIPEGVTVDLNGQTVTVKGPVGQLSYDVHENIKVELNDNEITLTRPDDKKQNREIHGTSRSLVYNMIVGVKEGFQKDLELVGVGYRAQLQGNKLVLQVGYSHPVEIEAPEGITFEVPSQTQITVKGAEKQAVNELAAKIRAVREPEPYKGKGIRYAGEHVRRKEGKVG